MAESKRTFQGAKMERDLDERLIPPGSYKDAVNISIASSEDANVGAAENLKGNSLLANQNIIGLTSSNNPKVIGSITHPEEKKIYYFVAGDTTDAVYEYNQENGEVKIIVIDSVTETIAKEAEFTFAMAKASATVAQNGTITAKAELGDIRVITANFDPNETGSTITQSITVAITVPSGWANAGEVLSGSLSADQASKSEPSPVTMANTEIQVSSTKLNGRLTDDDLGVTAVGFYWGYKTDNTELTISELESGGSGITRNTVTLSSVSDSFSTTISSLPSATKISFAAFATNSVGTGEGAVLSYTTVDTTSAAGVPRLPSSKLFIVPSVSSTDDSDKYALGYGDFKKADNNYHFVVFGGGGSGKSSTRFDTSGKSVLSSDTIDDDDFTNTDSSIDSGARKIDAWALADADVPNNAVHTITASADGAISTEVQIVKGTVSGTRYTSTLTPSFSKTGTGDNIVLATADMNNFEYNDPPTVPAATYKIGPFEQFNEGVAVIPFGTHTDVDNYGLDTVGSLAGTTTTFGQDTLGNNTGEPTFYNASDWSNLGNLQNVLTAFNIQVGNGLDLTNDLDGANNDPGQYNFQNLQFQGQADSNDTYWTAVLSFLGITKTGTTFPFDGSAGGHLSTRTVTFSSTKYFTVEWDDDTYMIVSATSASFANFQGYGTVTLNGDIVAGNGTIDKTEGFTLKKDAAPAVKFDATKLDVSITGKTAGVDYNYYVCDEMPGILGDNRLVGQWGNIQTCPAVVIEANPKILNNDTASVTHTVNITYNY